MASGTQGKNWMKWPCSPRISLKIFSILLILILANVSFAQPINQHPLRQLLGGDQTVNFLDAKLLIDQHIDPTFDEVSIRKQIETMADDILRMVQPHTASLAKAMALKRYLYKPGPWNQYNPFTYDLKDPQGISIKSKLLHHYLATRKGNCVSMPILVVILGERLGLDITLSSAPLHYFAKYQVKETGRIYNIEATFGGHFVKDAYYIQNMAIHPSALKNNLYLEKLSPKKTVAAMTAVWGEHLIRHGQFNQAIDVFDAILETYPTFAYAMVKAGHAYANLLDQEKQGLRNLNQASPTQMAILNRYQSKGEEYFLRAEALGWREDRESNQRGTP